MNEDDFKTTRGFKSYVSKAEVTALDPSFLVKQSKNVLIDYANRVISRNGYTLFGAEATTGATGIKSSYEWETSTITQFPIRTWGKVWEFYWNSTWNELATNFPTASAEWAKVWDDTEKIDVLLGVIGNHNMYKWSGGVSKIASSTSTSVTKQGVISCTMGVFTVTIATPAVFSYTAHGLSAGNTVRFTTTGALPTGIVAGTTYYVIAGGLTADAFEVSATLGGAAINTSGTQSGVHTLYKTGRTSGITFVAGNGTSVNATILDSNSGFVTAGFAAGDTLTVTGSAANSRNFTIASVTAGVISLIMSDTLTTESTEQLVTIHNGQPTWASARFYTSFSGRSIKYNGTDYTYAGGEGTDTLVGLTAFPTATAGDACWQTLVTIALTVADIPINFFPDLIAVQLNQVILGSTKAQNIYISSTTSYTDFHLTSPRAPADPAKVTPDNCPTCFVPIDNESQSASSLMIGAGTSEWFQLNYKMSQDNASELVRVIKLHTASGSGLLSKDAIASVKRATIYISREPALDSIGNIEKNDSKGDLPISDPIKDDFDTYDFTGAHVKYWKRSIYIAVPAEGLVLIYDMMRGLWQPPQTIAISRLAIIDDWLYGHSSTVNETYKLFVGTNDNGIFIQQVARFAYNNGGKRDRIKNFNEVWTDGYLTANARASLKVYYGFEGQNGIKVLPISGGDTAITSPQSDSPFGNEPFGAVPLGGASLIPSASLPGSNTPFLRFWQEDTVDVIDCTEHFLEFCLDTKDAQFALVAHGTNQFDAGTAPVSHKK